MVIVRKNLGGYMVRICGSEKVERILKIIRRYICGCNKIEHVANVSLKYITKEYDNQLSIKERIAKLINENEKYFIYEILGTTSDTILYDDYRDMERLKNLGYSHRVAVEIFEKYGILLYVTDLSCYVYVPRTVRYELDKLIEEYGLEQVTEEIAIYLKKNYSDKFGISIISTQ